MVTRCSAKAPSLDDAFASLQAGCPDIALLDIDVGGTPVWPLARELKHNGCSIVFVSANCSHDELDSEFPGCHVVDKPASKLDIDQALQKVAG